ncbi:MAG TPA: helix-turn-helix domain-containing protein [Luteolibacter sp.]|nr:helix-turn-helix domain-containing protein [Luteolibacter sp.]
MKRREVEIIQKDGRILVYFAKEVFPLPLSSLAKETRFNATELCTKLGVSERHLRRLFEDGIGIGAKEWLRQERMVVARNLLREGSPIKEVATQLGFANYKNLNREFLAFYGVTPSDYQRKELSALKDGAPI